MAPVLLMLEELLATEELLGIDEELLLRIEEELLLRTEEELLTTEDELLVELQTAPLITGLSAAPPFLLA